MHRIHVPGAREFIGRTILALPSRLQELLKPVGFLVGLSPAYVGLHDATDMADGRNAQETGHVALARGLSRLPRKDRQTTVVLPEHLLEYECVLLHELGHALDEQLGFTIPAGPPLDNYAATNRLETVATAFQSWATPCGPDQAYYHTRAVLKAQDPKTAAFWDSLSRGSA